jgi:tight adherence protein C
VSRPLLGLVLGGLFGFGLMLIGRGLSPRRASLAELVAAAGRPRSAAPASTWARVLKWLGGDSGRSPALKADLAVLNMTPTEYATKRLVVMLICAAPTLLIVLFSAGIGAVSWNPAMVTTIVVLALVGGYYLTRVIVASDASERRVAFATELSNYLDVVALLLAGGAGIDEALRVAATGETAGVTAIRGALDAASSRSIPVWDALEELAVKTRVNQLQELVSSVKLAGGRGAQVRTSLTAKADSLRATEDSEDLATSERATERMSAPIVVMFVVFIAMAVAPMFAQILKL